MTHNEPNDTGLAGDPADITCPCPVSAGLSPLELSWEFFRQADEYVLAALAQFFEARGMDPRTSPYWFLDMLSFAVDRPEMRHGDAETILNAGNPHDS